jgi:hypothetical protein
MRDLVLLSVVVAFFAVCVAYVRACEWIIGPDEVGEAVDDEAEVAVG